jgi:hypothetical protein
MARFGGIRANARFSVIAKASAQQSTRRFLLEIHLATRSRHYWNGLLLFHGLSVLGSPKMSGAGKFFGYFSAALAQFVVGVTLVGMGLHGLSFVGDEMRQQKLGPVILESTSSSTRITGGKKSDRTWQPISWEEQGTKAFSSSAPRLFLIGSK